MIKLSTIVNWVRAHLMANGEDEQKVADVTEKLLESSDDRDCARKVIALHESGEFTLPDDVAEVLKPAQRKRRSKAEKCKRKKRSRDSARHSRTGDTAKRGYNRKTEDLGRSSSVIVIRTGRRAS